MKLAIIPVLGRLPLVPHTIKQALKVVDKVLCITSYPYEREYCTGADSASIKKRVRISDKWNWGFQLAKAYDPDHVLFIGSSDWVTDNWMDVMTGHDAEIVGVNGFHLMHLDYNIALLDKLRIDSMKSKAGTHSLPVNFNDVFVKRWRGYRNDRKGEPIGIGRVLNRDFLKRIDYKPFDDNCERGLDFQMFHKADSFKVVSSRDIKCLSISSSLWSNLHKFQGDTVKIDFIDKWFPDAEALTEWTEVKLTNYELWSVKYA